MSAARARRVLVTGASRGIGRAVAEALLDRGAYVALVARGRRELEAVSSRAPERALVVEADVAVPKERERAFERALEGLGRIDDLVCAAGIARHRALEGLDDDALHAPLALNYVSAVLTATRVAQAMRGPGAIVMVGSTLAERPAPTTLAYAGSKAALHAAAKVLALELAPRGIRVNVVAPGVVDTEMITSAREHANEEEARAHLEALRTLHPLGRLGTPAEIAQAVLHLLEAEWTTGAVMTVDGGLTLR